MKLLRLLKRARAYKRLWRPHWRRAQTASLRLFLRLMPSEKRRVFALTIVLGVVCGLAAVAFHLTIRFAENLFINRAMNATGDGWIVWTIVTPTLGGILSGALLQYVVPDARGSGIPQVKVAYAIKGGRLSFRHSTLGKFIIGSIQIGTGASLGREGPTVQICAGIASLLGRATALSRDNLRRLLPVGAAAGIAAAFNAPIAAVTFTIEEVVGDLDQTVLSGVIVAAALAAAIERSVLGEHPVFDVPQGYGLHHASSLIFYAALGIAAAFVSIIFTDSLLALRKKFQRMKFLPAWMRPGIGGLVTGVLAVVALFWLKAGGVTGGGYETLGSALSGKLALRVMLVLCALKIAATVFSYGSGGAGGIFAPALFIGGMLGGAFGIADIKFFEHGGSEVGAFALVGMGAVFAGIVRAPMTSVLIIFEMTGSYALILPLMIANMTAYGLARRFRPLPIYEALIEQDGVHLPHRGRTPAMHALEQVRVASAMTTKVITLQSTMTVAQAGERIAAHNFLSYPVIDETQKFIGFVTDARVRRTLAEDGGAKLIKNLIAANEGNRARISAERPLMHAVLLMNSFEVGHLAVVEGDDSAALIGVLTMSDIVRAQARAALAAGEIHLSSMPGVKENKATEEQLASAIPK